MRPQGHPELADVFRAFGDGLTGLSEQQRRVIAAITSCRTAALGGHVRECDGCGYSEISYNSCRDRHCPKCQGLDRVRWQEDRAKDLLPVPYFHLVFTVPDSLHDLFLEYSKLAYGLLFRAVADSVLEVAANPENLGARTGMTAVLHTWTQTLLYHPHVHLIVPGGGLDPSGTRWVSSKPDFFLPVRILSAVFRGKLLAAIEKAVAKGKIGITVRGGDVARLLRRAARKKWVVYSKRPFAGPEQALQHLGRYTHRIAIGNERIVAMDEDTVTFRYRDRADGDQKKLMTLPALDFLRRFLLHVLPKGLVRIRHYGFLANSVRRERIELCRKLLGDAEPPSAPPPGETWDQLLLRLTGEDVLACPRCATGRMHVTQTIQRSETTPRVPAKGQSP
ncbi:MAG: IS91 family transposase [Candidatus Latescibacteria bacterium]|nr:IS91 family transposase [Candidatus Latescibacterota bacterium]